MKTLRDSTSQALKILGWTKLETIKKRTLSWSCETPRGPGLWKFNNTLLKDEEYVEWVRKTYSNTVRYYRQATSKGLL